MAALNITHHGPSADNPPDLDHDVSDAGARRIHLRPQVRFGAEGA